MKKFRFTSVVMILLSFCLILFYQNCAKEAGDLGVEGSITDPRINYVTTCTNQGNNVFTSEVRQLGPEAVLFFGSLADDVTQDVYRQKAVIPTNGSVCPAVNGGGCAALSASYINTYGPWVWMGCPCMGGAQNNFRAEFTINGYKSTNLDLRAYINAGVPAFVLYTKTNTVGLFNNNLALGRVNGARATCQGNI